MSPRRAFLSALLALLMLGGLANVAIAAYGAPLDAHERGGITIGEVGYGAALDEHERRLDAWIRFLQANEVPGM